jgi:hypothetical protein
VFDIVSGNVGIINDVLDVVDIPPSVTVHADPKKLDPELASVIPDKSIGCRVSSSKMDKVRR